MKESAQSKSKKTHQKSTIKQQQRKVRNEYKNKQEYTGPTSFHTVVAIGTSTGGPKALQKVLLNIPRNFPYPILIVQHMPSGFTNSLAYRLNETCNIRVKEAEDGDVLQGGTAYIAPGDYHMAVTSNQKIQIYQEEERQGHRPSVNILLESLANLKNVNKLVVILTGMGKDGSEGLKKLKEADPDVYVIAESEETAVIYGMPKAALETGYVNEILKLEEIGEKIISYAMKRGI